MNRRENVLLWKMRESGVDLTVSFFYYGTKIDRRIGDRGEPQWF